MKWSGRSRCCARRTNCVLGSRTKNPLWPIACLTWGNFWCWKGDYAEAELVLRKALEIRVRLFGHDYLSVAEVDFALAWTLFEMARIGNVQDPQRWAECEQRLKHAFEVQRRELGGGHREVGLTLTLYTMYLYFSGREPKAQQSFAAANVVMQQEGGQALGRAMVEYQARPTPVHAGALPLPKNTIEPVSKSCMTFWVPRIRSTSL